SGTLTLTGTSSNALWLEFGKSGSSGGGVYATESATVKINDNVNISRCRAGNTGCANRQNWNLSYGSVTDSDNGGALFIGKKLEIKSTNGSVNIYDNCASNGGAIYLTEKADLYIDANTNRNSNVYMNIFDNVAKHNGGAISTRGSISALKYVNLFRNLAQGEDNYAGNGGGIYKTNGTYSNVVTEIQDIKLTYNKAKSYGGAIYNEGNVTSGNTIAINGSSAVKGSAVYNTGTLNVSVLNAYDNGGSLTLNRVTETTNGSSNYKQHVEASYNGNTTVTTEGTVYNDGGSMSLSGTGKIQNNVASNNGSAIFNNGTITNLNCIISGNSGCQSVVYNNQYKSITSSVNDSNVLSITDNMGVNFWNYGTVSINGNGADKTNFTVKNGSLYGEILNGVSSNTDAMGIFNITNANVDIGSTSSSLIAINNARGHFTITNCKGNVTSGNSVTVHNQKQSEFTYEGGGNTTFTNATTDGTIIRNDNKASVGAGAILQATGGKTLAYGIYNDSGATLTMATKIVGQVSGNGTNTGVVNTGIYNIGTIGQYAGTIVASDCGIDNKKTVNMCGGTMSSCTIGLLNGNEDASSNNNNLVEVEKLTTTFSETKML
ncbi:hypothetical protein LEA_00970, partial [human gut metagenome]